MPWVVIITETWVLHIDRTENRIGMRREDNGNQSAIQSDNYANGNCVKRWERERVMLARK